MQHILDRGIGFVVLLQFVLDTVHTIILYIQIPCLKSVVSLVDLLSISFNWINK